MNKQEELAYEQGSNAAWRIILAQALTHLGRDSPEWNEKRWLLEREAAIAALRKLCRERGDNDWSDDLHLADIIEEHLASHFD